MSRFLIRRYESASELQRQKEREKERERKKQKKRKDQEREKESASNACEMDGTPKKSEAVLIYGCPWVELGRNVPALPSRYSGSGGAEFLAS